MTFTPKSSLAQQFVGRVPQMPQIPVRKTPAERTFESLRELHQRLVWQAQANGQGEEALPAWHVHLPSGVSMRIKWMGTYGAFMRFTSPDEMVVLVAPEALCLTQ